MEMKIKYHKPVQKIEKIAVGDWIDLRAAEDVEMEAGEFRYIDLGISVKLPEGYEMVIVPRSSTYKNFKIIQPNSPGIVDESYSSDTDVIKMPALALDKTRISFNDRICQFRIQKHQPEFNIVEVETLGDNARGGFGSTGK